MKRSLPILILLTLVTTSCQLFQQDVATTAGRWKQKEYYESGALKRVTTYKARIPKEVVAQNMDFSIVPEDGEMSLVATNWTSKNQGTIEAQGNRESQLAAQAIQGLSQVNQITSGLLRSYMGLPSSGGQPPPRLPEDYRPPSRTNAPPETETRVMGSAPQE